MLLAVGATLSHGGPQVLLGFGLWLLDVLFRYAFRARFRNTRRARLDCLPCDVTRVTLLHGAGAKGEGGVDKLSYMPGQYVFLCVPALSPYEWHPFSLSTAPCKPEVMLHVRTLGDWTCRLRELAATADGDEVEVLVDGPYGEPSVDVAGARYRHFLIIAGGIGITPMQVRARAHDGRAARRRPRASTTAHVSPPHHTGARAQSFCNQLLDEAARGRPLRMLWFAWVCPERSMIQSILPGKRASRRGVPIGDARAAEAGAAGAGAHGGVLPNAFTPNLLVRLATSESLSRVAAELDESDVPGADGHAAAQTAKVNGVEPQRRPSRARKLGEPAASAGAPDILHTEFYLTRARAPIEGAAADGATPDDPYHHASLRSGRPDFCKMLGVMRALAEADGEARVAVLACGPAQMLASARAACVAHSGRGVGFDLHTEMFEF
jgi:ferredoxin-NADP reductase